MIGSRTDRRRPSIALLGIALVGLVLSTPRAMGQDGAAARPVDPSGAQLGDLSSDKTLRDQADALRDSGSPVEAIERYRAIWTRLDARDDAPAVKLRASVASRMGNAHRMLGELDDTEAWWESALLDYQRAGALGSAAQVLGNLGVVLGERGEPAQGAELLAEAAELQAALGRPARAALALLQRSALWMLTGDLGLALDDAYQAADLLDAEGDVGRGGQDEQLFALCRHRIAGILQALGADEVATQELRVLNAHASIFAPAERAVVLFTVVVAEARAKRSGAAWAALEEARVLVEEGGLHRLEGDLLAHEGWLHTREGRTELGCSLLEEAVEIASEQGQLPLQLRSRIALADCRLAAGEPRAALVVAEEALLQAVEVESRLNWELWELVARAHVQLSQWGDALLAFEEALALRAELARDLELDALRVTFTSAIAPELHDTAVDVMLRVGQGPDDLRRALDAMEAGRSRMLLASILGADVPSDGLDVQEGEAESPPAALGQTRRGVNHLQRLRSIRNGTLEAAETPLTSVDAAAFLGTAHRARHARVIGVETVSSETIRQRMPRNMGAVVFRTGPEHSDVFWVSREGLQHRQLNLPEAELRGRVDSLIELLIASAGDGALRARFEAESGALGELLLGPFLEQIRGVRHLVVVPDGDLYRLPWAALRPGGRYLVEETSVGLAPSLNILDALLERRVDSRRHFVALADPAGDLPRAGEESRYAASLFDDGVVLEGVGATWGALSSALGRADVLHLATHGELSAGGAPSYLALAGAQATLDVQTILGLQLDTSLVTLSACRSARGTDRGGEALVNSLARAFLAAGAETVVGSLWDVHDGSTHELMNRFYEEIAAGSFVVDALADAQAGLARSEGPWSHPWYWAGFVSVGDTR